MNFDYESRYKSILCSAVYGRFRNDRTGVGSFSVFNQQIEVDVLKHLPILTSRKMFQKTFETEFLWFINGETNIKRFRDAGVKIWDSWADEDGELGPVYGHQMLNFNGSSINQYQNAIDSINEDPDSRRHIISLWNPQQTHEMNLPSCYLYFQFFVDRGYLDMFVLQRSGDLFLGVPYDVAMFTLFLNDMAFQTHRLPRTLALTIVDAHVYKNQLDSIDKYLKRDILDPPEYAYDPHARSVRLLNYKYLPPISAKVAV